MTKVLVTHSETFHCDEVCAVALLKLLYGDIRVIRTRDLSQIDELNSQGAYVIDVGQQYNHEQRRYDHHQDTFNDTWTGLIDRTQMKQKTPQPILLSSCGLVYRHYGPNLIEQLILEHSQHTSTSVYEVFETHQFMPNATTVIHEVFEKFYYHFVQHLDAHDNGVPHVSEGTSVNYTRVVTLPSIVSSFNSHDVMNHDLQHRQFMRAVDLASTIIHEILLGEIRMAVEFEQNEPIVAQALREAQAQRREWLVLTQSIHWQPVLKKLDPQAMIKLVILPRGTQGQYQVSTRRIPGQGFKSYVDLITPDEAKRLVGENLVFLHRGRFIGVTRNLESAQLIASESLRVTHSWNTQAHQMWTQGSRWVIRNRNALAVGTNLVVGGLLLLKLTMHWSFNRIVFKRVR